MDQGNIENFIEEIKGIGVFPPRGVEPDYVSDDEIKKQIEEETDWRKKVSLAAKIISNHLG